MEVISFTSLVDSFKLKNQKKLSFWLQKVILSHQKYPVAVTYIFCDDEYLLEVNKKYLKHKTYTDIITFNYNHTYHISGDIFISIDRVRDNAGKYNSDFDEELHRVMVHGVLHLLGYNDKSAQDKKKMVKKENESLAILAL